MKKFIYLSYLLFALAGVLSLVSCGDDDEFMPINTSIANSTYMEAVDLGLSVDWASCNVGAMSPSEYGGHYCWGDPTGKLSGYTVENVKEDISGTSLDIVHANFGNGWRMPTEKECRELLNNCTSQKTTLNGVAGYKYTGKTGNSIFLPLAGYTYGSSSLAFGEGNYGYYWSSTGYSDKTSAGYLLWGNSNGKLPSLYNVSYGLSVRGVKKHKDTNTGNNGNTGGGNTGGGNTGGSTTYEKPDIGFYDFTATTKSLKVQYKIYNKDEAKVTSAKIYYGTSSNPTASKTATVSGVLITANISGLKAGTTYYVKCVATGKGGTTTTKTTKCITNY